MPDFSNSPHSSSPRSSESKEISDNMQNMLSTVERSFVMPPTGSEPYFGHQMTSWRQDFSNGSQQMALVMNSMSGVHQHAVVADARRIQGMETTIRYLQELLAREVANKFNKEDCAKLKIELEASYSANSMIRQDFEEDIRKLKLDLNTSYMTKEALKKELVEAIQDKENFKDKLKESLDGWNSAEAQLIAVQNEYQETHAELIALKSELVEVRVELEKAKEDVKNLEVVNKIAEEESKDLVDQIKILRAEKSVTVVECSGNCQNTTVKYNYQNSIKLENTLLKEENDALKTQLKSGAQSLKKANEELLEQLAATKSLQEEKEHSKAIDLDVESGTALSKQFQELAKKYIYVIAYCEREEYLTLQERTNEFLKALEMERQRTKDPVKSTLIQHMSETVLSQLKVINDCLAEIEFSLDLKIEDINAGTVLVSDLNLRTRPPRFEIPPDHYERMLNVVINVGVEDKQTI